MTDLASAAFRLCLRGMPVFPLKPGAKEPLAGSHGHLDASVDADVARARWAQVPLANIAIATGAQAGFWVLDIDAHHGGDKTLGGLVAQHGELPETVSVKTPSGGLHLWFRWPQDVPEIRNSAGRVGPGIDVRGEGGYITVPPSVLADGRRYFWVKGPTEILPAPDWLVDLALPPPPTPQAEPKPLTGDVDRYCAVAIAAELLELEQAGEGRRNEQLNRSAFAIAGFVRSGAVPESWARQELETRALAIGLSALEAQRTIDSAFQAAEPRDLPQ